MLKISEYERLVTKFVAVRRGRWVCWVWQEKQDHRGYGRFWHQGQWRQAHRITWKHLTREGKLRRVIRELPDGLPQLNHRCENRDCVRPSHLEPCTMKMNHAYRAMMYWKRGGKTRAQAEHTA